MEVDLQRKRIALTMRLDEQPGESNAQRRQPRRRQRERAAGRRCQRRGKPASASVGNSAMGELAAAFGKKR